MDHVFLTSNQIPRYNIKPSLWSKLIVRFHYLTRYYVACKSNLQNQYFYFNKLINWMLGIRDGFQINVYNLSSNPWIAPLIFDNCNIYWQSILLIVLTKILQTFNILTSWNLKIGRTSSHDFHGDLRLGLFIHNFSIVIGNLYDLSLFMF